MSESIYSHILLYEQLSWSSRGTQDKIRSTDVTSRSKFLNSLALLLNGNATCTAVYISEADKTVHIARNGPITASDQRYFDRFFSHIQIYAHLCFDDNKETATEKIKWELDSHVFEYNSKKIISRFIGRHSEVIDGLRKLVQCNTDEKSVFIKELQSNQESYRNRPLMTEEWFLISEKYSEDDYIEFLLKQLDRFLVARDALISNRADPTDDQLILAARCATLLYQSRLFRYMLNYSKATVVNGVYYFEKTSGHQRSLGLLLKCLLKQNNIYGEIYKNISWKLVPPIEEKQELKVTPRQAFENIFTKLLASPNKELSNTLREMTSNTFYDEHLKELKEIDEKPIYVGHVHAEILLIDYLLKNNINKKEYSNEVGIGISKMPCLLCSEYIGALNQNHHCCFYQSDSTHGKIYGKWIYRPDEDPAIINLINDKLIEKIQYSIQKLCLETNHLLSKNTGDSDIIDTSLEEKAFDKKELLQAVR
jgi:hypothetical protein